jgi:hypothetical protein
MKKSNAMTALIPVAGVLFLFLIRCTNIAPYVPEPVPSTPQPDVITIHSTYTVNGDKITEQVQDSLYQFKVCADSALDSIVDTVILPVLRTLVFRVTGDTLLIQNSVDSADKRWLDSNAVVHKYEQFIRIGAGTGLEGSWRYDGLTYRITAGQMTDSEKAELDTSAMASKFWMYFSNDVVVTITQTTIARIITSYWSELFLFKWNNAPSAYYYADSEVYAVDISQEGISQVRLAGRVSTEVVTITYDSAANWNYLSTNTLHAPYTYFATPDTCPNEFRPSWWDEFMNANAKSLGTPKRSGLIGSSGTVDWGTQVINRKNQR